MNERTLKILHQAAQIHGFIPKWNEGDEKQEYRQKVIYDFVKYVEDNHEDISSIVDGK